MNHGSTWGLIISASKRWNSGVLQRLSSRQTGSVPFYIQGGKKVAWMSSDFFESLLLPQLLRGENDSKQSDEFQASKKAVTPEVATFILQWSYFITVDIWNIQI